MEDRHINSYKPDERRRIMVGRLHQIVLARGGAFDEQAYVNKRTPIVFRCSGGHDWVTQPQSVLSGSWCRLCWNEHGAGKYLMLPDGLRQARNIATSRRGACFSEEYFSTTSPMSWRCENGHEWSAALSDIKKGTWCPECGSGARERLCRHYFENITELPFPKARPKWLKNALENRMELDGYCESIGLAFEHQGEQHYRAISHFNRRDETLARRIEDDESKRRLCAENGVSLIEIPHYIPAGELRLWIHNNIARVKPPIRLKLPDDVDTVDYVPSSELSELRAIARARGGECLSAVYLGVQEKHKFRCSKGHVWDATASNVKTRTWCPECKPARIGDSNRKHSVDTMSLLAAEQGGKFLSSTFKSVNSRYLWGCAKGHQWLAAPTDIMKGTWCPDCACKARSGNIEEMRVIAESRGGSCMSEEYISSQTKLLWRCEVGHEWEARPDNVKNRHSWCPVCAKNRRGTV